MSDDRRPDAVWAHSDKRNRGNDKGRAWLIVALVIAAVAIICVPLYFLLPLTNDSEPAPSTPISDSSSPSATSVPTADPDPTTEPAPPAPDLTTFTEQVQPRLDDGVRGLQLVTDNIDLGAQIVDSLQQDASLLSDAVAPSAIDEKWNSAVSEYAAALNDLRSAYDNGADPKPALSAAGAALTKVRAVVGL